MQIKFLQTKTALACLAGAAMVCAWAGVSECYGMDDWEIEYEIEKGVERAMRGVDQSRAAQEKEEKEKRKAYAFKTGRFTDDWEGAEFKRQYQEKREREKKIRDEYELQEKRRESGPASMERFHKTLNALDADERNLWEEWDKERNWRAYFDVLKARGLMRDHKGEIVCYSDNIYFIRRMPRDREGFGVIGGKEENIVGAGQAGDRNNDIIYFMEHMADIPAEVENLRAFRIQVDAKYKNKKQKKLKDKKEHQALFPKQNARCNLS